MYIWILLPQKTIIRRFNDIQLTTISKKSDILINLAAILKFLTKIHLSFVYCLRLLSDVFLHNFSGFLSLKNLCLDALFVT